MIDRGRPFLELCRKVDQEIKGSNLLAAAARTKLVLRPRQTIGFNMDVASCIEEATGGRFDLVFYPGMGSNLRAPLSFRTPKVVSFDLTNPLSPTEFNPEDQEQRRYLIEVLNWKFLDHHEFIRADNPALSWASELSLLGVDLRTLKLGRTRELDPRKGGLRSDIFLNSPLPGAGRVAFVNFFGVEIPRKVDEREVMNRYYPWNSDIESQIRGEMELAQRCLVLVKAFPLFENVWYKIKTLIPDNCVIVVARSRVNWTSEDPSLEPVQISKGTLDQLARIQKTWLAQLGIKQGDQAIYGYLRDLADLKIFNFHKQA